MNYDKAKYRKIDWKHFMMLHWIINPGLMINELILGQRIPKVMLMERKEVSGKSWVERGKVPCPHCNTIHEGQTWGLQNKTAFKNWFGLYCPSCGGIIPCLMNITTFLVLLITAPIWYWFKDDMKRKWLAKQPERYQHLNMEIPELKKHNWWKRGLGWGLFMFIFMSVTDIAMGQEVTSKWLLKQAAIWTVAGLIFGLSMRALTTSAQKKQQKSSGSLN